MDFFDWSALCTLAGCSAATALVTQFVKVFTDKLPPQLLSYIVALILMFCATYMIGGLDINQLTLVPLNALVASFAANGSYDAVKNISG